MVKTAIVTGGSRGIGRAISLALGDLGWQVVINYSANRQAADETLKSIKGGGGIAVQANIAEGEDRERLVQQALGKFGRIDLLINNAGIAPDQRKDILEMSIESYDKVMGVNLTGPFFLTQRVAQEMIAAVTDKANPLPQIININSISAYTSSTSRGEYCLSKAGMAMMTALFADRLAEYGIGVYEIRPGIIETDMTEAVKEKYDQLFAQGLSPIQRWGTPDDVAKTVIAIVERYFPYSTGEVFNVDGGFHLRRL
jgi:NAD(P)-dependent dehydrogenase (short-subunit alcohol dehydrogenase family)